MKYRHLGNTGLQISELSMGTWLNFHEHGDKQQMFSLLARCLDLGINCIDTADIYFKGESERVVGEFIQGKIREELIIASKCYGSMSPHWMQFGLSLRHIRNACENSLKRLRTDYMDLYQCHRYDVDTPLEETCYAMNWLIEKGYILHWGVSQWSGVQITNAVRICEQHGWRKPVSEQPIYNMLNRGLETDVMGVCEKEGVGLICYSPLSQGLLTGKYTADHTPSDSRKADEEIGTFFPVKRMTPEFFKQLDELKKFAGKLGISMPALALAWCLSKRPVSSLIIGASKILQIDENCKALEVSLNEEQLTELENILQNAPVDQYTGNRIGYGIVKRGF